MSEFQTLENRLKQLRPLEASKKLRERCIQAALSQKEEESPDIWTKWLLAASILLVFSLWIEKESQTAFFLSYHTPLENRKNLRESELAEISYFNKILLSSIEYDKKYRITLLDTPEVPGRYKR